MFSTRWVAGIAATVLSLSACSAEWPEPDVTGSPPVSWAPTTPPVSLEPTTMTGPYGDTLRLIPRDPAFSALECRGLTEAERAELGRRFAAHEDGPATAVDITDAWAIIAYRDRDGFVGAFLTDGVSEPQGVTADGTWRGTHTRAGVALEGGTDALGAALDCLG